MKTLKVVLMAVALLAGAATATTVLAHGGHGGHVRFGLFFGAPVFAPWYYSPPPYYYPAPVIVQSSPPVYVERGEEAPSAPRADPYWYYCPEAGKYYPYVDRCPGGWQRVTPTPPRS